MTCQLCGGVPTVKYVTYVPFARCYFLCGACALVLLWDKPAQAWVRAEVIAEAEAILEAV